jgi:tetratricopeptide (TPR) repeat protein
MPRRTATKPAAQARGSAPPVRSEEEYTAARSDYDALLPGEPNRIARRDALLDYLVHDVTTALERDRADDAEGPFKQALTLYAPVELRDGTAGRDPADGKLVAAARAFEKTFRKRGAHEQVLAALAAQLALVPKETGPKQRWGEVVVWLEGAVADDEMPDGNARMLEDLEAIARVFPSPFIVEELARRYHEPAALPTAAREGGKPSLRALRELVSQDPHGARAYELARLYLRVSDLAKATRELDALRGATKLRTDEGELAQVLDKAAARDATALDWVNVAKAVIGEAHEHNSDDRDVALQTCRDAEARFPKAIEPGVCTGQLARSMEALGIAQRAFEAVRALDPTRRETWEELALLYQARLFQMVTQEDLDVSGLPAALAQVEQFHADAAKRFPSQPLKVGLSGAVFEVGRGYYNAGRIAEAEKYLQRSIDLEPSEGALELLAQIRLKRGDPQRSAVLLERAINIGQGPKEEQLYHRARLRRLLGDAVEASGEAAAATQTRRGALEDWDVLLDLGLQKEYAAEALLEKGKVLYQLGERDEALRSFARSIDALPDRGSSYADVIAFLIPRGELADALDAYHRALGRTEVTDYLKVYCSLWITDLAHRAGQPEDELALAYLRGADGSKWFDDLARWATGRETESELISHADTPAKRAESAFYRSLKALRDGHLDQAKALWKDVMATDMMAFFEYDMATLYLHEGGAPSTPRIVKKNAGKPAPTPRPQTSVTPPPDSI